MLPSLVQVAAGAHETADDGGNDGNEEDHSRGNTSDGLGAVRHKQEGLGTGSRD